MPGPGKPFKKGNAIGKLGGRPPEPPELRVVKNLTKAQLLEVGGMITGMTMTDLEKLSKDPKATVIQGMVAALVINVMKKGDAHAFEVLMNRLLGKVTDKIRHEGIPPGGVQQVITMLPVNGFEKAVKKIEGEI